MDTDLHETPTPGYGLLNVKLGLLWRKWTASIVVDNLLSRFYYENLSRPSRPLRFRGEDSRAGGATSLPK